MTRGRMPRTSHQILPMASRSSEGPDPSARRANSSQAAAQSLAAEGREEAEHRLTELPGRRLLQRRPADLPRQRLDVVGAAEAAAARAKVMAPCLSVRRV